MIPTRRTLHLLLAGLPLAAVPLVFPPAWVLVVASWVVLLLACAVDVVLLTSARPTLALAAPHVAAVHTDLTAEVTCTQASSYRFGADVTLELEGPMDETRSERGTLRPGSTVLPVGLRAHARGVATIRAVFLRVLGPFGLVARVTRDDVPEHAITIIPDVARVKRMAIAHFGSEAMLGGARRERWAGEGGEFESLQAYVPGMDTRSVDWKATARHHALRVRRHHLERRQRVVVAIDTGRTMAEPIDGLSRLDHAVHAALLLARVALAGGDLVGLHAYGAEPRAYTEPRGGASQMARLRTATAALTAEDDETNHVLGLRDLARKLGRRSMVVVFTEFTDATTAELMVETLGHLSRRHLVVFVSLDDPLLEEPLVHAPETAEDLAAAVIAGGMAQRRHQVLARLRRMGVLVTHARPGPAAGELLDRYLEVKRRRLIG